MPKEKFFFFVRHQKKEKGKQRNRSIKYTANRLQSTYDLKSSFKGRRGREG